MSLRTAPGSTSGDHDVSQAHGGLDVLVEGGLDKLVVLLDDTLDVPASLADVPAQAAHQADVRVCVHEYLQIQELKGEGRGQIPPGQEWDSTHLPLLPHAGLSPAQHLINRAWLCSGLCRAFPRNTAGAAVSPLLPPYSRVPRDLSCSKLCPFC